MSNSLLQIFKNILKIESPNLRHRHKVFNNKKKLKFELEKLLIMKKNGEIIF